jgi:threonine/homoserine/homoserine lactone efflux protein
METLYQILGLIGAGLIVWLLYRTVKGRPEQFSRENLSKSFSTMGVLALILIGIIALLVFMLRHI